MTVPALFPASPCRFGTALLAGLLLGLVACRNERPAGPMVVVIVLDGVGRDRVSAEDTPVLDGLLRDERTTRFADGRAVMPTVTNTNHVAVATGARAAGHGITGNNHWPRDARASPESMISPSLISAKTVFTLAAEADPPLRTALVAGKSKLGRLFGASERQHPPRSVWVADRPGFPVEGRFGIDEPVTEEVLRVLDSEEPDFLFVALSEVDLASHLFGPRSEEARAALRGVDRFVGRIVERLRSSGLWNRTVLLVTSDHAFEETVPGGERRYPPVFLGRELDRAGLGGRLVIAADGGVAHVYLRGLDPAAPELDAEEEQVLSAAAGVLERAPEVEALFPRLPVDGQPTLAEAHPEWAIDHPASGDLLVVSRPGFHFVDPFHPIVVAFAGQHGSPRQRAIPLFVTGGHPRLAGGGPSVVEPADNADVGATVIHLLGLGEPVDLDGETLPARFRGRVLVEAFTQEAERASPDAAKTRAISTASRSNASSFDTGLLVLE